MAVVPMVDQILDRMAVSVPDYPNVYWIGRKASRLTFLSQQQRAFNLIWAVNERHNLGRTSNVGIVGAGLAGLSAAFAAHKLGARVTLFDRKPEPLHLQRGSQLRFIHPNILDWPEPVAEQTLTDLPCLNWGADTASNVCDMILQQWKPVQDDIDPKYECDVRKLYIGPGDRPTIEAEGASGNVVRSFDHVILAVGFGLERSTTSVPFLSYWENDNLGRPVIADPIPRRYLVTGCGDGGLIDAVRLQLKDFDHADFVYEVCQFRDLGRLTDKLREIDRSASEKMRAEATRAEAVERLDRRRDGHQVGVHGDAELRGVLNDIESEYIEQEYRKLEIPSEVRNMVVGRLRKDTIVFLNSPRLTAMSLSASILNRFMVFLLTQYGGLRYRAGEMQVGSVAANRQVHVSFRHPDFPIEELAVHEVIIRHGPAPAIDRLLPRAIVAKCRPDPGDLDDPTRVRQYPASFLNDPELLAQRQLVHLNHAIGSGRLASKQLDLSLYDRFSIQVEDGRVAYVVRPRQADQVAPPTGSQSFAGIPFEVEAPSSGRVKLARPVGSRTGRLASGTAIQNQGKGPLQTDRVGFGTLGCFVQWNGGDDQGILTAWNVLRQSRDPDVGDLITRPGTEEVIARLTRWVSPTLSSPRTTMAAENVWYNRVDAAIARLDPDVRFTTHVRTRYGQLPHLATIVTEKELDESLKAAEPIEVFKAGAASGVTYGHVVSVVATAVVQYGGPAYHFEGLVGVIGENQQPFSLPGDGGALVRRADGAAIGLLIAGGGGDYPLTLVCPLDEVLRALECELVLPGMTGKI